jgi:hypothetical protein
MENIDELEDIAKKYAESKRKRLKTKLLDNIGNTLIRSISEPHFAFPIEKKGHISEGTTTYIYVNNFTYPNLFEFLSELLHMDIPIIIDNVKFGPGEILINNENEKEAMRELDNSTKDLQKLVSTKIHS